MRDGAGTPAHAHTRARTCARSVPSCVQMPNISFIKRKPRPFGTELKVVAGTTGAFRYIEIQVGGLARRWPAPYT